MTTATTPSLASMLDLSGRTAIVTGAAMGIGKGIVSRLAEAGAAVLVADADLAAAEETAAALTGRGLMASAVQVDVSQEDQVAAMVATAIERTGRVDILVNNAGIFPFQSVLEEEATMFNHVVAVNLVGTFLCCQAAARAMIDQGHGGRIVNITSIDALHPSSVGLAHYDASKHGVWGFTKNLALELAPHNIQVNAVAPGAIETPGAARAGASGEAAKSIADRIPMGRIGHPDDIARAVVFLASDLASYVTGSQLVVDGGLLLR